MDLRLCVTLKYSKQRLVISMGRQWTYQGTYRVGGNKTGYFTLVFGTLVKVLYQHFSGTSREERKDDVVGVLGVPRLLRRCSPDAAVVESRDSLTSCRGLMDLVHRCGNNVFGDCTIKPRRRLGSIM